MSQDDTDPCVMPFEWNRLGDLAALLRHLGRHGFKDWPGTAELLRAELVTLRLDPEQDIAFLGQESHVTGYAIALPEADIDRIVVSIATTEESQAHAGALIDFVVERARQQGMSLVHVALRGTAVEPGTVLESRGFRPVASSLELLLRRGDARSTGEWDLPEGYLARAMRSNRETLLLTRVQNEVFDQHWGFSKNTPEEVQARLDLPISGPEYVLFIEDPDGDVAGYAWTAVEWVHDRTLGRIWMTGLLPRYREHGLGRAVIATAVKHLLAEGAADIQLEVVADNVAAARIYNSIGFKKIGRTEWLELRL